MQDLAQIRRQNGNQINSVVPNLVAEGKHVVVHFTGLNYAGHKAFDTAEEAGAYAAAKAKEPGVTVKPYSPEPVAA